MPQWCQGCAKACNYTASNGLPCCVTCMKKLGLERAAPPEARQCALASCEALKQGAFVCAVTSKVYCNAAHLEADGGVPEVPAGMQCALPTCRARLQHDCPGELPGVFYCQRAHIPAEERARMYDAVAKRIGLPTDEIVLRDKDVLSCAARLLQVPLLEQLVAAKLPFNIYIKGVSANTAAEDVQARLETENATSCFGEAAVLKKADGSSYLLTELRQQGVKIQVLAIGRYAEGIGGATGIEGCMQSYYSGKLEFPERLWTGVSGCAGFEDSKTLHVLAVAYLPNGVPPGALVKQLSVPFRRQAVRYEADWNRRPALAELATEYTALVAEHGDKLPMLFTAGETPAQAWNAYVARCARRAAAHAAPESAAGPQPSRQPTPGSAPALKLVSWDRRLKGAKVLFTEVRLAPSDAAPFAAAGAEAVTSQRSGAFSLVVRKDAHTFSKKVLLAAQQRVPVATYDELRAALLSPASAGSKRKAGAALARSDGVGAGAAPPRFVPPSTQQASLFTFPRAAAPASAVPFDRAVLSPLPSQAVSELAAAAALPAVPLKASTAARVTTDDEDEEVAFKRPAGRGPVWEDDE